MQHKFQEIGMDPRLALIAQLIECQGEDPRVHGSNPFSKSFNDKIIVFVFHLVVLFAK